MANPNSSTNPRAQSLQEATRLRNLAQRLPAPARLAGRIQRTARTALTVLETATTTEVMRWTRRRGPLRHHDFRAARRALRQVGRASRSLEGAGTAVVVAIAQHRRNLTLSRVAGLRNRF